MRKEAHEKEMAEINADFRRIYGYTKESMQKRLKADNELLRRGIPLAPCINDEWKPVGKPLSILKPILKGGLNEVRPGGWRKLRFCVDSGAGETVVNEDDLPEVETKESWGSKRGLTYEVANGAEIHNEGEKTFSGCIGTVGRRSEQ